MKLNFCDNGSVCNVFCRQQSVIVYAVQFVLAVKYGVTNMFLVAIALDSINCDWLTRALSCL